MPMEGEMRATLLTLTVAMILFPPRLFAREFNCFDTPEGGHRCACMGECRLQRNEAIGQLQVRACMRSRSAWDCGLQLQRWSRFKEALANTRRR